MPTSLPENAVDGQMFSSAHKRTVDVIIVGSGPAGASVGYTLTKRGVETLIMEEGPWFVPDEFPEDGFTAMARLYRDLGTSLILGNSPMPYLQGRAVGGSSVVNGAISWRLPRDIHDEWLKQDPELEEHLPWQALEEKFRLIEADLNIHPTEPQISGWNNLLLARGAEELGLEHRPIHRNVKGCRGLGRCLQGCPEGNKMSMDRSYLPSACSLGAILYSSVKAERILHRQGRAIGVIAKNPSGVEIQIRANRAVVITASAIQTPLILLRSGIKQGPVGRNFQCHPGVSLSGRFAEKVRMWTGATQGHEVTGLRSEGIKFEALGYDMAIVAMRLKGIGEDLSRGIGDLEHWANWGAAIRAQGRGSVKRGWTGPRVLFSFLREDVVRVRRSVRVMGEMMLAAGADYVTPGVVGWHQRVSDRKTMARFEEEGPLDPKAYPMAATHLFGTCRMGSDPSRSVVRPDFRHHQIEGLYIADSSVFPSNTGVNPQTSIIAMAMLCAENIGRK